MLSTVSNFPVILLIFWDNFPVILLIFGSGRLLFYSFHNLIWVRSQITTVCFCIPSLRHLHLYFLIATTSSLCVREVFSCYIYSGHVLFVYFSTDSSSCTNVLFGKFSVGELVSIQAVSITGFTCDPSLFAFLCRYMCFQCNVPLLNLMFLLVWPLVYLMVRVHCKVSLN